MRELASSIEIEASSEAVWAVLTDFASYPAWNPFITSISGDPRLGSKLTVRIEPPGGRAMAFKPTVTVIEPDVRLQWLGRLFVPGLFDGEHTFRIETIESGRVRFHQSERFSGLAVPVLSSILKPTLRGFEAMNEALKQRVEGM